VKKVIGYAENEGLYPHAIINAPIRKGKNVEYVVWLKKTSKGGMDVRSLENKIKELVKLNSEGKLS
jgi:hypothetical protein